MSLLLALQTPASTSQVLAITLDEIIVSVSQVSNHNQSLAIMLDGIAISVSQTVSGTQEQNGFNLYLNRRRRRV